MSEPRDEAVPPEVPAASETGASGGGEALSTPLPSHDSRVTLTPEELELLAEFGACIRCKTLPADRLHGLCDVCDEWANEPPEGFCERDYESDHASDD